ncbi:MAG TPA: DUF192 domain-containing protein [Candidatus Saccharibacteria bacterium]|nr:DUF192 domain-containing protein [Candidatus Saccharibacteria bacterium]
MQNDVTKKTKLARRLLVGAVAFIVGLSVLFFAIKSQNDLPSVNIGDVVIPVEIATSSQEKQKGLCCRNSLPENQGMLFVYEKPGNYRFWMKDTRIPLDMYWISSEKKIVHIEENVQPESYKKSFGTDVPSQYVLETNAGFAKQHNIRVGDTVEFNL